MWACQGRVRLLELLLIVSAALLIASISGSASAAPELARTLGQQPDSREPLAVVDNFLTSRNARNAMGATFFCARLLAIDDAQGQWIGEEPMVRAWLKQLTDTYLIDTLVRPRADGERVVWVERLTHRGLPYSEAVASSVEVSVEVVVVDGRITSYSALYPELSAPVTDTVMRPLADPPTTASPGLSPTALIADSAFGLAAAALLVLKVGLAILHARRSKAGPQPSSPE